MLRFKTYDNATADTGDDSYISDDDITNNIDSKKVFTRFATKDNRNRNIAHEESATVRNLKLSGSFYR